MLVFAADSSELCFLLHQQIGFDDLGTALTKVVIWACITDLGFLFHVKSFHFLAYAFRINNIRIVQVWISYEILNRLLQMRILYAIEQFVPSFVHWLSKLLVWRLHSVINLLLARIVLALIVVRFELGRNVWSFRVVTGLAWFFACVSLAKTRAADYWTHMQRLAWLEKLLVKVLLIKWLYRLILLRVRLVMLLTIYKFELLC
jgi:hypothetical protein